MPSIADTVKRESDRLAEKVIRTSKYLGYDLTDASTHERLVNILESFDPDSGEISWKDYFFALAYISAIKHRSKASNDEIISALCTGNWALGMSLDASSKEGESYLCYECLVKEHSSEIGKKGAANRHAPVRELRAWAVKKYKEKVWRSANAAAHALKESVMAHGRDIGAVLSEENAQRTIADWFRKSG